MVLHSITINPDEDRIALNHKLEQAEPGQVVLLREPPYAVQVEIVNADPSCYTAADSLVPGKYVVPLFMEKKSQHEPGSNLAFFRPI